MSNLFTTLLENGLRVTIVPQRRAPIVAVNLWYHVGSANEREGRTGFAHLFEHMLFQGSEHVQANEHFEIVQRAGGTLNGSTWLDRTNYFETVPSHQLPLALWLEADRMARLLPAMTQEKLDTQRDVVKNERRWTIENQPYGSWWERLPALAFPPQHPFHHSLMGSMEDLSAASLEDVAAFFRTYYTPDNAVLSIVGDTDVESAMTLVREHFASIAPAVTPRPALPNMTLPKHFGAWRREFVPDHVTSARLFLAFRIPPFGIPVHRTATLLASALGNGRGSVLYRALVREAQIATSATAFTFDLSKGSDLLVIDVTARPGVTAEQLESAVVQALHRTLVTGFTEQEVERARILVHTEQLALAESCQSHADRLSQFATYFGDPAMAYTHVRGFEVATQSDMADFCAEYLGENNRLSLCFVPSDGAKHAAP